MAIKSFKSTLQYHEQLNPKLWDNFHLKPVVRQHLLAIADKWCEFANIPADAIINIVMTGGNVNFNFTSESDIDVHILIDPSKMVIQDREILRDIIFDKKDLWAKKHNITVYGYPVELYAQSIDEQTPAQQGIYSLSKDTWVIEPNNLNLSFDNDFALADKVRFKIHQINKALKTHDVLLAKEIKDQISIERGQSLSAHGEFGIDNLVFKELRNRGHLQKLKNFIDKSTDKGLSLEAADLLDFFQE